MSLPKDYTPEFDSIKDLLFDIASERSLENLLWMIVRRFAARPHIVLAKLWLIRKGDNCEDCVDAVHCKNQEICLKLEAVAGEALNTGGDRPFRIQREHRLPLGYGTVGKVAVTGESHELQDVTVNPQLYTGPESLKELGVRGISIEPLVYRGEVLGVSAVYLRMEIPEKHQGAGWHRLVANHAAVAISNARAFDEIEDLKRKLEEENAYLRQEVKENSSFDQIIGASGAINQIKSQIQMVASTDASVLILGETGTGKELIARQIHYSSARREMPLIKVNCGSVPRELWESEFFGHIRGAFTGALKDRAGRFELADGGTLFLDEVGEIPLDLQTRLLRVLQEGQFEKVGDEKTRQVNVRIIAATNRNLEEAVDNGQFRQDLYYRLAVFPIEIAPLRERVDDIPLLASHFIQQTSKKLNRQIKTLSTMEMDFLQCYHWPGNVRELHNIVERLIITGDTRILKQLLSDRRSEAPALPSLRAVSKDYGLEEAPEIMTFEKIKEIESQNIERALERTGGKIYGEDGAAKLLGVRPTTLASRIKKMKLTSEAMVTSLTSSSEEDGSTGFQKRMIQK